MGHRGAAGLAPENTLAGFRRAAGLGVSWIELDVRLTADDAAVLSHDESLARATGLRRKITHIGLADLAGLDAGAWFAESFRGEPLPTLTAAMRELAGLGLGVNVEVKRHTGHEDRVMDAVAGVMEDAWPDAAQPPLISSFDPAMVAAARRRLPGVRRALIAERLPRAWRHWADSLECYSLHFNWKALDANRVAAIRDAGYPIAVYTVNDAAIARRLWSLGVDCVISDRPDVLLAARTAFDAER
jgi:glycerophosphoryl diester phosphodiesterase